MSGDVVVPERPPARSAPAPRCRPVLDWPRRDAALFGVVIGAAAVFSAVFATLAVTNHRNYGTWAYDLAIYDQGIWTLSQGRTFISVRGLPFWGHHVNVVALGFVPFYWLGGGPALLVATQAMAIGAGAIPLFLVARLRLRSPVAGAVFAAAYLLYAPAQFLTWRDFHPEALVITPLLWAWFFALTGRWRWFWAAAVLVLSIREDAALALAVLGAVLWWRGRRDGGADPPLAAQWRRHGRLVALVAVAWFVVASQVIIPLANGGEPAFYVEYFYGRWGGSFPRLAGNLVRHPDWLVSDATQPDRLRYYRDLLAPMAGLPLLAPVTALVAVPQLLANVIAGQPYPRSIFFHYTAVLIAPLWFAAVDGARRLRKWRPKHLRTVLIALTVCAYVTNVAWSPSPLGERFERVWARDNARRHALDGAVDAVPADAVTSSTFNLTPHLAHRRGAFDWPNPWVPLYYGNAAPFTADCSALVDPGYVDHLVIDRQQVGAEGLELLANMTAPGGDFEVVYDVDDVVVARRIDVGPGGLALPGNCSTSVEPVLDRYRVAAGG